jgi:hypothetical protein
MGRKGREGELQEYIGACCIFLPVFNLLSLDLSILSQLGSIELASERDDPLADPYLLD